jgi:hypothetical protein
MMGTEYQIRFSFACVNSLNASKGGSCAAVETRKSIYPLANLRRDGHSTENFNVCLAGTRIQNAARSWGNSFYRESRSSRTETKHAISPSSTRVKLGSGAAETAETAMLPF